MALARLTLARSKKAAAAHRGLTLVVYAPYGSDPELSGYPDGVPKTIETHPLVRNLAEVAASGVHVCALVDLVDDSTWLVEFTANRKRRSSPRAGSSRWTRWSRCAG